jgi:hypothetical protein
MCVLTPARKKESGMAVVVRDVPHHINPRNAIPNPDRGTFSRGKDSRSGFGLRASWFCGISSFKVTGSEKEMVEPMIGYLPEDPQNLPCL